MSKKTKKLPTKFTRGVYPTYLFKDHDPIIDAVMTVIQDAKMSFAQVGHESGVSVTCLRNWNSRRTKRPQFATIAAVTRACGGEITVHYKGKVVGK